MEFEHEHHELTHHNVQKFLGELFDDLYLDPENAHFYVGYGSTVLEISVEPYGPEETIVEVTAYCVQGTDLSENLLLGSKLSEFHTGYRAFSRKLLETLPLEANSDDFVFDNQMIAQIVWFDFKVAEVSCPTRYATDASSINFQRSVVYGFGCLGTGLHYRMCRMGITASPLFPHAE